ncbi:MAG: hypothetical protein NC548_26590 [Lachnospiraceae bacterium]|nr:hypothetical protein [Lachnospiraceae bacterium]
MEKLPYTYALLLPTLSPAAKIAVYEDTQIEFNELYRGTAVKSKDRTDILSREVRHIGINELKNGERPTLEIFVE